MNNQKLIQMHIAMARSNSRQAARYDRMGWDMLAAACRKFKAQYMRSARQLKADACR